MKKKSTRKLNLSKETLTTLEAKNLTAAGGAVIGCQESRLVCSIQHTCVSCAATQAPACQ